ncbi:helix-turn-helix- domain containing protein type [Stagonosporopsis vannaccii]|nr:helix-turn-helix- domain containing protein type [Stagonosporopsis vannaccii]
MAPKSLHAIAITPIIVGLRNAAAVLRKGEAHAKENNIDPEDYLSARFYPDMGDFRFQVYRFSATAQDIVQRCNPSAPTMSVADDQKTFAELVARVESTAEYLESLDAGLFDGREDEEVVITVGKNAPNGPIETRLPAFEHVVKQAHPYFWFHVTTMYDLLRNKGVPVGKFDYLNGAKLIPVKFLGANK